MQNWLQSTLVEWSLVTDNMGGPIFDFNYHCMFGTTYFGTSSYCWLCLKMVYYVTLRYTPNIAFQIMKLFIISYLNIPHWRVSRGKTSYWLLIFPKDIRLSQAWIQLSHVVVPMATENPPCIDHFLIQALFRVDFPSQPSLRTPEVSHSFDAWKPSF